MAHLRDVSGDARLVDALAARALMPVLDRPSRDTPAWCGALHCIAAD